MTKFIGRRISVGFAKETSRGTAASISTWIPNTSIDYSEKYENIIDESSVGVITDSTEAHVSKQWSEGKIEGQVGVELIGLQLLSILGSVSSVVTSGGGAYTHTFSLAETNSHQSLTIGMKDPVSTDYSFPLAMLNKLTITAKVGEFVKFSAEFKAKKGETATHTVAYITDHQLLAKMGAFKVATNLAGLDAASAKNIEEFEITLNSNTEEIYSIGSVTPSDIVNKQFSIEGSFTAIFESEADYKTAALAGTNQAIRFSIIDSDTTIGVSDKPTLIFNIAKANYSEWSRAMGNNEIVKQTIKFKGLYSIADSQAIGATLINTTTSY